MPQGTDILLNEAAARLDEARAERDSARQEAADLRKALRDEQELSGELVRSLGRAGNALRSFQYGNASEEFAQSMAEACEDAIAKASA